MAREMKDSGIEWIGEIPKHWDVKRIKNHLFRKEPRNPGNKPVLSLYREYGIVLKDSRDDNHNVTSLDTSNYKYVIPGDFVINKMKAWQGSVAVSNFEGIVSPAYFVYHFKDSNIFKAYFHYLLRSCYKDEFRRLSGGIREGQWDLPSDMFENTLFLMPPYDEQRNIATFLDSKCAEIDKVIEATKASIEEYKKLRQAIITEAVTKGLDPAVEMKDSGIGDGSKTPIKWKLLSLKRFVKMNSGDNLTSEEIIEEGSYPVYGGNGFRGYYHSYNCSGLHVLIGRQGALAGNIHIVDGEYWATDHAIVVYNNSKIDTQFLYYKLIGMNLNQYAYETAAQPGLAVNKIINLKSVFPISLAEQKKIADYLDTKCAQIDSLIKSKEKLIEELTAYRKSLIYEYVTGKKEVPAV